MERTPEGVSSASLRRVVTRWEIVGISLNDVIGSGIYLLPAAAAALLGTASVWAVLGAALVVGMVVLCFAEASSYFEEPGSAYLYTRVAFGDFLGFEVGWMAWLTRVAAVASLSVGFAQALEFLVPAVGAGWPRVVAIAVPLVGLGAINVAGVKAGVRAASLLVVAKLAPLLVFVLIGAFHVSADVMGTQRATQPGDLGAAALLLLFAFAGFENTPVLAGEYRNPRRDVPFALLAQLAIVTTLYVGVQIICLGVLPDLPESTTPLADAATLFLGTWGGWLLTVGAVISILGTVANSVLAGPRYLYAVAKDGFLPGWLGAVHPRFHTPAAAIGLQTLISLPLALTGGFVELAALSVVARLATYLGTAAAVPVLRRRFGADSGFQLPGGPLIPILACMLVIGLGLSASSRNLIVAAVAMAVGAVFFFWFGPRGEPRGQTS